MFSQPRTIRFAAAPCVALQSDISSHHHTTQHPSPAQWEYHHPLISSTKTLYFNMLDEFGNLQGQLSNATRTEACEYLQQQLQRAEKLDSDFPEDLHRLPQVLHQAHEQTARAYRHYLNGRQQGEPRRYFRNRSHALYFLRTVAPTKLVDGAWLYGLLPHWQDRRIAPLIRIYLEELGCGQAAQNHVLLFQKLLTRYGCDHWQNGAEENFTQGTVQLALASHADEFFPEVIGFNLGYEQLPLHLLITAYELNELDIDPYYFSLHVTIDNASTGHAHKALQSVQDCLPRIGDRGEFLRRVANGYRLNAVGKGTLQAIAEFDLEQELMQVLAGKAMTGAGLHSDYCVIEGRPVSDWLAAPHSMRDLLRALQNAGWIRRGESPEHSRFWHLLTDQQAPMFGVFNLYEQQLLHDWIQDDPATTARPAAVRVRTPNRFRPCPGSAPVDQVRFVLPATAGVRDLINHHAVHSRGQSSMHGNCADVEALFGQLETVTTEAEALAVLTGMLSPANHATPAGLAATRLYTDLFNR